MQAYKKPCLDPENHLSTQPITQGVLGPGLFTRMASMSSRKQQIQVHLLFQHSAVCAHFQIMDRDRALCVRALDISGSLADL